jgi:hypothetical protein
MMMRIAGRPIAVRDLADRLTFDLALAHGTGQHKPGVDGLRIALLPGFDGDAIGNAPLRLGRLLHELRDLGFGLRLRLGAACFHAHAAIVAVAVAAESVGAEFCERLDLLASAAALPDLRRSGGEFNEPLLAGQSVLFSRCADTWRAFGEPSAGAMRGREEGR